MIASAEQLEKLMKLTLKKNQDPEYLESKIASLETSYGCRIEEKLIFAAIVKAGGKKYSADICSKMKAFKRAGGNVTSADLIQAMMESFRISGKADSDTKVCQKPFNLEGVDFDVDSRCKVILDMLK